MLPHEFMDQVKVVFQNKIDTVKENIKDKLEDELSELALKLDKLAYNLDEAIHKWFDFRDDGVQTLTPEVDPIDPQAPQVDPMPPTDPEKQPR